MVRWKDSGRQRAWVAGLALIFTVGAAAEDAKPVKVIKDVSYGPHARNVMDLYVPEVKAGEVRPLIVCIHGGGWAGGDKKVFGWLGEAFARRGFVVASITYRFAPRDTAPAQIDDAQRAVRWLRKNAKTYGIDAERVGAIGGSAGGHLAACLGLMETRDNSDAELAEYSSRVQAVVDCYGPVDLVRMMKSASGPIVRGFVGKPLEGNEEAYRRASPVTYVAKGAPPFLIVHGTKDVGTARGQVPMEQSEGLHEKLREVGAESTLLKLEGAGHGFTGNAASKYAQQTLAAAGEFFERYLGKRP
jgi:acetyl esterase/lipase